MWITHLVVVTLALALFGAPSLAAAQPTGRVHQVGLLGTPEGPNTLAFRQGLHELGYAATL